MILKFVFHCLLFASVFVHALKSDVIAISRDISDNIAQEILNQKLISNDLMTREFNQSVREYVWNSYGSSLRQFKGDDALKFEKYSIRTLYGWYKGLSRNTHALQKRYIFVDWLEEGKALLVWFVSNAVVFLGMYHLFLIVYDVIKGKRVRVFWD